MDRDSIQFIVINVNDEEKTAVPLWLVREVRTLQWKGNWHIAVRTDTRLYMVTMNSASHANRVLLKLLAVLRAGSSVAIDVDGTISDLGSLPIGNRREGGEA